MNKINIFILAAGLGERLRPITDYIPKPLLPILNKPALQHILDKVESLPFSKIGINLHYKKEMIQEWLASCALIHEITTFPEIEVLGTGGALKNAEKLLGERTFLVHNSDVLSDVDLEKLLEHHLLSKNLVTLAVQNYPKFNSLVVDGTGYLKGFISSERLSGNDRKMAYTGIAVYEPEFLNFLPEGVSSVVDTWLDLISAGHKINTFDVSGCSWNDIGTPSAYASAVFNELRSEGEVVHVHTSINNCSEIDLKGHVVIGKGSILEKGVSLKNCILMPGSTVRAIHEVPVQHIENCIIGPDYKIDLNAADILDLSEGGRQLIGTGGSDRRYYRVKDGNKSAVLMQCKKDDPDFVRHLEYSEFLLRFAVPVPELIRKVSQSMQALFEDAGDISLYSYLQCPRQKNNLENVYRKIMEVLTLLHAKATERVSECPILEERIFDYDHFRWETEYFMERFVEGARRIGGADTPALKKEFHNLAMKADSYPKTIIHRDFQSQNIMMINGGGLRVLDYQGARIGPPAYDVASLLWDPYYRLEDSVREQVLDYYVERMMHATDGEFNQNAFRESLITCRLQRHMQALGAYGFLAFAKGKKYFMKYVPEGLRLLKEDISLAKDEYPELYDLTVHLENEQEKLK